MAILDNFKRTIQNKLFGHFSQEGSRKVYHYTSISSLNKIIKSRILRAHSYEFMNDPWEVKYGVKVLNSFVNKSRETLFRKDTNLIEKVLGTQDTYPLSLGNLLRQEDPYEDVKFLLNEGPHDKGLVSLMMCKKLAQWIDISQNFPTGAQGSEFGKGHSEFNPMSELFILSFSCKHNSLSQWYMYGEQGAGACLEFELNPKGKATFDFTNSSVYSGKVFYDSPPDIYSKHFEAILEAGFEDFHEVLSSTLDRNKDNFLDEAKKLLELLTFEIFRQLVTSSLVFIKKPFFKEEEEVRLVASIWGLKASGHEQLHFDDKCVPYITYSLHNSPDNILSLKTIFLGPKCQVSRRSLDVLLKKYQHNNVEVIPSEDEIR